MGELIDDRDSWLDATCSIAATLDVVGNRSTLLLLREAALGTTRFDDFARRAAVSEPVAAARLKDLVAAGLLRRRSYREPGSRTRAEYVLTPKGQALVPVLTALRDWGDAWVVGRENATLTAEHEGCGASVHARLRCDAGHDVDPEELRTVAGPGLGARP
ncbi:winged helix-turn-helix transcriptional regulator [Kineococcus aurantiacus]|uniref:DNA-binding HxlR family transcriptional regulator n=1 Tax=Kineococcus aurantiacus TaxID=37633 RepID=A0A7Y9ARP7_9ACTN|nr:helix-turn-helix domain-containing protein [Kineococcus aurantiacus]NYD20494.1 DNA-binding HxlR family transcriptional regulator [Kineococcus aurantiacus]